MDDDTAAQRLVGYQGPLTGDVDGDGRDDAVYLLPHTQLDLGRIAVRTAGGALVDRAVGFNDKESLRVLGVSDGDGDGRSEIFVQAEMSVGAGLDIVDGVALLIFRDCSLQFVTDATGTYEFPLSPLDPLSGVGCVDVDGDGGLELARLEAIRQGAEVTWSRFPVTLDGTTAVEGEPQRGVFRTPADDELINLLGRATCGTQDFRRVLTPAGVVDLPEPAASFDFLTLPYRDPNAPPFRFNPCEPHPYVINPGDGEPEAVAALVQDAFAELEAATGVDFVYEGLTDEVVPEVLHLRGLVQTERYGERWAPILVDFDADIVHDGWARPAAIGDVIVSGVTQVRPESATRSRGAVRFTLIHELAHMAGLAHVPAAGQVMSEVRTVPDPTDYQFGDLQGLRLVGAEMGCLPPPPLAGGTPPRYPG